MILAIGLLGYTWDALGGLNLKHESVMVNEKLATTPVSYYMGVLHDFAHWVIGVYLQCSRGAEFHIWECNGAWEIGYHAHFFIFFFFNWGFKLDFCHCIF
jgi:hypothetical protein